MTETAGGRLIVSIDARSLSNQDAILLLEAIFDYVIQHSRLDDLALEIDITPLEPLSEPAEMTLRTLKQHATGLRRSKIKLTNPIREYLSLVKDIAPYLMAVNVLQQNKFKAGAADGLADLSFIVESRSDLEKFMSGLSLPTKSIKYDVAEILD